MQSGGLDVLEYYRWASENLADNRNRGIFAEWMVGQALDSLGPFRIEWDDKDLVYRETYIEVRTAGLHQWWNPDDVVSDPSFNLAPPRRSEIYVFCLHTSIPANKDNVANPDNWEFWVISRRVLDDELCEQKGAVPSTLDRFAKRIPWKKCKTAVDRLIDESRVCKG